VPLTEMTRHLVDVDLLKTRKDGALLANDEDSLAFNLAHGIRPSVEVMPFTKAPEAYERMISGEARFRVVLDTAA
jgi:D-arabinose 1-dehydrogenase-like Zn-dependent alcohol dehydrogenase